MVDLDDLEPGTIVLVEWNDVVPSYCIISTDILRKKSFITPTTSFDVFCLNDYMETSISADMIIDIVVKAEMTPTVFGLFMKPIT